MRTHDTQVIRMDPAPGRPIAEPLRSVVVELSAPPRVVGGVTVTAPTGEERAVPGMVDGSRLTFPFAPDAAGRWTVARRVASGDGHEVRSERFLDVAEGAVVSGTGPGGLVSDAEAVAAGSGPVDRDCSSCSGSCSTSP